MILLGVVIAAGYVVYCGNTYFDPNGPGMMVPVMCATSALLMVLTTLAVITKYERA